MGLLFSIASWLDNTGLANWIRTSSWAFPAIETAHVFCIVNVVGSISVVDLRLLGLGPRKRPVSEVLASILPWTWRSFIGAVITGGLLFTSNARQYYRAWPFRLKMSLLVLAGVNMAIFHLFTERGIAKWNNGEPSPLAAKLAGGISLCLWIAIIFCGRWIGFVVQGA